MTYPKAALYTILSTVFAFGILVLLYITGVWPQAMREAGLVGVVTGLVLVLCLRKMGVIKKGLFH
jgi:hypothetical protein